MTTLTPNRPARSGLRRGVVLALLGLLAATALALVPHTATAASTASTSTAGTASVRGWLRGVNQDPASLYDGPLAGASVLAISASTGKALKATVSGADGGYTITGLPAGGVRLRVTGPGWLKTYVGGALQYSKAATYTLVQGRRTVLPTTTVWAEAAIQGQTLGTFDPLGEVTVTVVSATTGKVINTVVSDLNGDYRVGQLPPGPIKVQGTKAGWLTDWANNRDTFALGDTFTLHAGQTLVQSWSPEPNLYLDLGYIPPLP